MSDFHSAHQQHVAKALDQIHANAAKTPPSVAQAATLSLCAESIARLLADAAQIEVGAAELMPWAELQPAHRERFRQLAEIAIESLDTERDRESVEYAVNEIILRDNSYGRMHGWAAEEIARETLAIFRSHQSLPKVTR